MNKIRKGDEVIVLAGRTRASAAPCCSADDEHAHRRRRQRREEAHQAEPDEGCTGGIVDKTMPIHQSNVAIFNAATGKAIAWASRC
jgi:large subunit ribosomal protein L24